MSSPGERGEGAPQGLFYKGTNPMHEGKASPNLPFPNTLGVRISTYEFRGWG